MKAYREGEDNRHAFLTWAPGARNEKMQSLVKVATCRDCTKAFVLVGKRRGIVFVKMALGGWGGGLLL